MPHPQVMFATKDDSTLIGWWNDRDGALSWMLALELELESRGYAVRDDQGHMAVVTLHSKRVARREES